MLVLTDINAIVTLFCFDWFCFFFLGPRLTFMWSCFDLMVLTSLSISTSTYISLLHASINSLTITKIQQDVDLVMWMSPNILALSIEEVNAVVSNSTDVIFHLFTLKLRLEDEELWVFKMISTTMACGCMWGTCADGRHFPTPQINLVVGSDQWIEELIFLMVFEWGKTPQRKLRSETVCLWDFQSKCKFHDS